MPHPTLLRCCTCLLLFTGCAKGSPAAASPEPAAPAPSSDVEGAGTDRSAMTSAECEAAGGTVVGDIGDGAIFRPEYTCPESGAAPLGNIADAPTPGGPIAVEGSVCCPAG